ncbi:MAG: ABC transporter permease subunit [Deltaproteobacteria bacterium]|nr:ABC transporter permease subunit [Deltaproteobacteria bacterium]
MDRVSRAPAEVWPSAPSWMSTATFVMAVMIIGFGFWIFAPIVVVLVNSFNLAPAGQPAVWSMENWILAFSEPGVIKALGNTFLVYFVYTGIGFPVGVLIAWTLARTDIPQSRGLEFMFWLSFMLPSISTTVGWVFLLDPDVGLLNRAIELLPFVEDSPFNIYSVGGIIWTHLMANTISGAVMLLTPAFRNMDSALEEASRTSGASNFQTMMRVTFPVMVPPIILVFMLSLVRIFQSFETEQILGTPINFYVYSTKIFQFVRFYDPPNFGAATALASIVLAVIAVIVPTQRWLISRKRYTVVTGRFKPGLIHLGPWRYLAYGTVGLIVSLLTIVPVATLVGGSFMTRVGWFTSKPLLTLRHYHEVLTDHFFLSSLWNTFVLAFSTAVVSPILFSLVAYVLVRTQWRGRTVLDSLLWMSTAMPGILSGLGLLWLFLGTPFLTFLYGTMYALVLVVILQGKLTSTQLIKGVYLQMGSDMEEAARVLGSGWWSTYFRIWIPLLMPTLVLIGVFNFVIAAGTTSSIILLAERGTKTLSILSLELMSRSDGADLEGAGIVSLVIVILTAGVALIARKFGLQVGVRHI